MKRSLLVLALAACACVRAHADALPAASPVVRTETAPIASLPIEGAPIYGERTPAAHRFVHDGVQLYYEVHGAGAPLLLVHGNGADIGSLRQQVEFFRAHYTVIAMDSRDHGRSADSTVPLTSERMADDLAALIDHLGLGPVSVVGWSDGGIEALLLGMRHPGKVTKLVAMAANLDPDGIVPELTSLLSSPGAPESSASAPAADAESPMQRRARKVAALMLAEPNIDPAALRTIASPTLVIAGDHDLVRDEHTLLIFHSIPNSQLAIIPGATHMVPFDDAPRFNAIVARFLGTDFVKPDRVKGTFESLERMRAEAQVQRH
jgi:pimeloyl-ACP methyl ester carboxylesterase